jgi:hypothetical protein
MEPTVHHVPPVRKGSKPNRTIANGPVPKPVTWPSARDRQLRAEGRYSRS